MSLSALAAEKKELWTQKPFFWFEYINISIIRKIRNSPTPLKQRVYQSSFKNCAK